MQQFYKREKYKCTGDDWPPYQPDHFTSVALIHHKEKLITSNEVIAIATKTYQGKVGVEVSHDNSSTNTTHFLTSKNHKMANEYFKSCQSIKDITQIFKENSSQNSQTHNGFILIEGAPGIGKTILSKEIAYQWANNNLLSDKTLLFLIFLRDPKIKDVTSLRDFVAYALCLQGADKESRKVQRITQYLEETSGSHVTIVLDGYDEISDKIRHNCFITDIINRKTLMLCGLVITSRPTTSSALHGVCDCRIEILGFTEEDRMAYIKQSLKGNDDEFRQVKEYLEKNPFINSLCYIPLNMTILICLFKNFLESGNYMLPKNQTQINEQFVCITISRFLMRKGVSLTIESLEKLPKPYKQQLRNLSKLAFDLLGKNQIVFDNDDVKSYVNWSDLGLLKTVKFNHQMHLSYNFLHFSLQEFLAAYHVRSLFTWNQIKILKEYFEDSSYYNMWIMYAGLTNDVSFAFRHFLTGRRFMFQSIFFKARDISTETISDKIKCLRLFQCFLEAGDDKLCQQVGNCLMNENIDLSNTTLLRKDMHTLCFFLIRSTVAQWKLLDLSNCYIGDYGFEMLVNLLVGDGKSKVKITKMSLSNNYLTSRCVPTILKLVQYFDVNELTVIDNTLDSEMLFEAFFTPFIQQQLFLNHEMLLSIKMSKEQLFFAVNCKHLLNSQIHNYFQINENNYLYLWDSNFEITDLLMLIPNVITHSRIQLNIWKEDSNESISKIQSEINNLKIDNESVFSQISYILISQIQILAYNMKDYHIIPTMECRFKQSILKLCLTSCVLSTESLCTIGNILSMHCIELEILDISGCSIGDIQFENFYRALFPKESVIKQLRELNFSNNHLTSLSIGYIIHLLQLCSINKLVLSNNEIDIDSFNTMFFTNRYDVYCNFHSKVPLKVINHSINNKATKNQDIQGFEHLHFTPVYFLSTPLSDNLVNIVATDDYLVWMFLINTKISMDCFSNVIRLLSTDNIMKITIIEEDLKNDVTDYMITQLKTFQVFKYNENRDTVINYCLSSCHNMTNINVKQKMLNINVLESHINHYFLSLSFFQMNSFSHKHWELIDLSNCNTGDNGCTMLLNYFAPPVYTNTINVLYLSNNNLSSYSTDNIAKLIVYSRLQTLFVSHNDVKEKDIADAVCKLQSESNITTMPVIRVFKKQCVALIIHNLIISSTLELFNYKSCNVTYLSMTNCYLNDKEHTRSDMNELNLSQRILQELKYSLEAVDEDKKITHFIVKNCIITHKATVLLASEGLMQSKITHFKISHCKLQENAMLNILNALEETASLVALNLTSIFIPDSVAIVITNIICKNVQLEEISLCGCSLHNSGLRNMLLALNKLSLLKFINLNDLKCHCSMNYDNEQFQSILTSTVCKNQSLEGLNIANWELTRQEFLNILKSISQLKSIKHLDISGSTVTYGHIDYLENAIRSNTKIEHLNLSKCNINIPEFFSFLNGCKTLIHLDISHNLLVDHNAGLFRQLFKFKPVFTDFNFKYLNISYCKLTDSTLTSHVVQYLKQMPHLRHLNISHNEMCTFSEEITLAVAMKESLEHLELSECGPVDLGVLCIPLQQNSMLKNLSIKSSIFFNSTKMHTFLKATNSVKDISTTCLEYLDLSNCNLSKITLNLSGESMECISHNNIINKIISIIFCNICLVKLNLSKCELSESQILIIAKALNNLSRLKYLDISHNKISDKAASELGSALSTNQVLEHLNLSSCQLLKLHIAGIAKGVSKKESSLMFLDISHNTVTNNVSDEIASVVINNPLLEHLNLANCELSELQLSSIFEVLSKPSLLTFLDISHNSLTNKASDEIASVVSNNPLLEHLNLANCELSELQLSSIFEVLSKPSLLTFLDISHNRVTNTTSNEIASVIIYNPFLEHLNLASCELSELHLINIVKALRKTTLLTVLDVSHSKVTGEAANEVASIIINNKFLQHLNLSACDLLEDSVILIGDSLSHTTSLVSLDMSYNCITEKASQSMAVALSKNTSLEQLNFCASFEDNAALIVFIAINQHSVITHLNMSLNIINSDLADLIVRILINNMKIEHLDFGQCDLQVSEFMKLLNGLANVNTLRYLNLEGNEISKHIVPKITSLIHRNRTLKYINVCNCNLSNVAVQKIFQVIGELHSVEYLKISGNQINTYVCKYLKEALSNNNRTRYLDCSRCTIKARGTYYILMSINSLTCFEGLDFQSCQFNDHSASRLLPAIIINNKSLKYLNLTNCNLQDKGITIIAKALQATTAIKYLFLSSNPISNAVSPEIALAVCRNCKLKCLGFSHCRLQEKGLMIIAQALCETSSLKHFDLSHNGITDKAASVIASAISNNTTMQYLDFSFCTWQENGITTLQEVINKLPIIKEAYFNNSTVD